MRSFFTETLVKNYPSVRKRGKDRSGIYTIDWTSGQTGYGTKKPKSAWIACVLNAYHDVCTTGERASGVVIGRGFSGAH